MRATLHVRKRCLLTLIIAAISTLTLLGPIVFIHFPRTCIPHVNSQYSAYPVSTSNKTPSIVMLSGERCMATNPESKCQLLGDSSYHSRREYIEHHQGRYLLRDNFTSHFESVAAAGYIPAWAKVSILLEELDRNEHDWIFWIDTDALIVNMDIQLERFIDNRYSLMITKDLHFLNAGVFMLKVNEWSRQYFRAIWDRRDTSMNEQDYMITLLEDPAYEVESHVKYLPQCSFNSYWEVKTLYEMYRPGDFIIHWAGHNFSPSSFSDWKQGRFIKLPF